MSDSVPSARYSSVCNVLRQWSIQLIPTYRVYRLYDNIKSPPSLPESSHQRVWDAPFIAATVTSLLEAVWCTITTGHFSSACCATPKSGAWFNAIPISSLGLQMDDDVMRIAAGLRLGVAICHLCSSCGADVDSLDNHGLSCRSSSGCHCRHAAVNDIVKK